MEMVPFRTTPESLSFNARMVARLAAPMAFFYLGWIFENGTNNGDWVYSDAMINSTNIDGNSTQVQSDYEMLSAFANFYQLQLVSGFGDALNTVYPGLLLAISFLVLTNLINRILVLCKLPQYQFGEEFVTDGQLRDGKTKLERQKKMMVADKSQSCSPDLIDPLKTCLLLLSFFIIIYVLFFYTHSRSSIFSPCLVLISC